MTLGIHRRTARLRGNGLPSARALSRAILLAAGALVLASCGESASSANKRQVKSAAGAIATAQMALVAWLADAAPTDYARRTVKAMREKLATATDEIAASDAGPAAQRAITLAPMRQSGSALERAEQAIKAGDRAGAERAEGDAATAASNFAGPAASRPPPRRVRRRRS